MIDSDEAIAKQLALTAPAEVTFADGKTTQMAPARFVPVLADEGARVELAGPWRVVRWPFDAEEADLAAPGCDDAAWETVTQPGKVLYADPECDPRSVADWSRVELTHLDPDEGAMIRRTVAVPQHWQHKRVFLRFDAIYPGGRVYCNGTLLGEHLSGLTPIEYEVTDLVTPGQDALVAVRLIARHKHVRLDMPRHAMEFVGLAQDARLHAVENCCVSDYRLAAELDEAYTDAALAGAVELTNVGPADCAGVLTVRVCDAAGGEAASMATDVTVPAGGQATAEVRLELANVALWNDEYPNLYTVTIALACAGQTEQPVRYRTGFRRFELDGGRPRLNGKPVKFRGVNHLTMHPEGGLYTPSDWLRRCLTLMKRANVNAIRTHFLGPPALAELCDEMGIYLLQELPFDWGTDYVQDPDWFGPILLRLEGGVRRDRHHPALMVWAVGNENMPATREAHDDFYNHLRIFDRLVKTLDPSRPTMFPPPGPANKIEGILETRLGDIGDIHYSFKLIHRMHETGKWVTPETWDGATSEHTREQAIADGWSGVWFSSEYGISNLIPDLLNAPYVSVIADRKEDPLSGKSTMEVFADRLREEWGLMRDDPTCLGGAYFPWICASSGDPAGWMRLGEDADWGVMTSDLLPKPFFWAMRVIFSPVRFPDRLSWRPGQDELVFEITNGYNAIDLRDCTLRTQMAGGGNWMGQMRSWRDVPVACAPGESVEVHLPIWDKGTMAALKSGSGVVCRCSLMDPKGFRAITHDIVVVPAEADEEGDDGTMPIGPDAVLA